MKIKPCLDVKVNFGWIDFRVSLMFKERISEKFICFGFYAHILKEGIVFVVYKTRISGVVVMASCDLPFIGYHSLVIKCSNQLKRIRKKLEGGNDVKS